MRSEIRLKYKIPIVDFVMYAVLIMCINSSQNWGSTPELTPFEIFRSINKLNLFGQIRIHYLYAIIFLAIIFLDKFGPQNKRGIARNWNYVKAIFWMYFVPVNILVYTTIYVKEVQVNDLGVRPIMLSFVYLVFVYYVQDIFLKKKTLAQLMSLLTVIQVIFLVRCFYSIIKHYLGSGKFLSYFGLMRMGQENDFADYFILLFLISLVRLLFEKSKDKRIIRLNYIGIFASSFIVLFSLRRYLWVEYVIAVGIVFMIHSLHYGVKARRAIISVCSVILVLSSVFLLIGPERMAKNFYIGRFLTAFSLVDSSFESQFGTDTRHPDHLREGWANIKKNWLFGVSPYGGGMLDREMTQRHGDTYFHNAYIEMWIAYGLLGIILFIVFYLLSIRLSYQLFFKYKNWFGLVLGAFLICQIVKNVVWDTFISQTNLTVIYIVLISIAIRLSYLLKNQQNSS